MGKNTSIGVFTKDPTGLWHYSASSSYGVITSFLDDALNNRPGAEPCWFWFIGTPAPMFIDDTANSLLERWSEWRTSYQSDADCLLDLLQELSGQSSRRSYHRILHK
jgi:hypothetical protein